MSSPSLLHHYDLNRARTTTGSVPPRPSRLGAPAASPVGTRRLVSCVSRLKRLPIRPCCLRPCRRLIRVLVCMMLMLLLIMVRRPVLRSRLVLCPCLLVKRRWCRFCRVRVLTPVVCLMNILINRVTLSLIAPVCCCLLCVLLMMLTRRSLLRCRVRVRLLVGSLRWRVLRPWFPLLIPSLVPLPRPVCL